MTGVFLAVDPSKVKPGWVAFLIVLALMAATFVLWRNMNRQLHKIDVPTRASFIARDRAAAGNSGGGGAEGAERAVNGGSAEPGDDATGDSAPPDSPGDDEPE